MTDDDNTRTAALFGIGQSDFFEHLSFLPVHSLLPLLQIFEKIRCKAFASRHSSRAPDFSSGTARAAIRRKYLLSPASFLHVPIHFRNSCFETASSASS